MLSDKTWEYIDTVLSCVNYTFDRKKIRLELLSHISERIEFYMQEGKDEAEANTLALRDMGDARILGQELNRQHKPLLGWLIKHVIALAIAAAFILAAMIIFNTGMAHARNQEIQKDTNIYISSLYWEMDSVTNLLKYADNWDDSVKTLDISENPFIKLLLSLDRIKSASAEAVSYLAPADDLQAVSNMVNAMDIIISCAGHGVTYNGQLICYQFLEDGRLSDKEVNFLVTLREELLAIQKKLEDESGQLKKMTLSEFSEAVKDFTYKYRIENLSGIGASNE